MISEETLPETQDENAINARDLRRVFWRSFQMEFSWNYERQMNLAFVYALIPVLKKLYPQKSELAAALKRHLGPILFLLVFNVPHILVRWLFTRWGYVLGTGVLHRVQKSGMMESLTYGASIIGLMVVGAMAASMINITIPISFGAGEAKTEVQGIIDNIMPCLLPLVSFGIVYWLLGRKVKPLTIIGGMALVGILGSWIGLF